MWKFRLVFIGIFLLLAGVALRGSFSPKATNDQEQSRDQGLSQTRLESRPSDEGEGSISVDDTTVDDTTEFADASEPDASENSFIGSLKRIFRSSPVFKDREEFDSVEVILDSAEETLGRVKRENLEVLRQAARQQRANWQIWPNVMVIVADRLSIGDLSCYGQERFETPNIDQLAKSGLRFDQFYAGSSDVLASQWCMTTGRDVSQYPKGEKKFSTSLSDFTIAETMWRGGYRTGFIGKWHSDPSRNYLSAAQQGFDEWFGVLDQPESGNYYPEFAWSNASKVRIAANSNGKQSRFVQNLFTEEILSFLSRNSRGRRPFFLQTSITVPGPKPASLAGVAETGELKADGGKDIAAAISNLDDQVGRILEALDSLKIRKNTIVILTSNAAPDLSVGDHPKRAGLLRADNGLYEGRIRVPLIVSWPGRIKAGGTCNYPSGAWDLLPTIADVAGVARKPAGLTGISLVKLFRNQKLSPRKLLFWESRGAKISQAVRFGKWKAVRPPGSKKIELYDLESDPGETQNVASIHPEIVEQSIRQ